MISVSPQVVDSESSLPPTLPPDVEQAINQFLGGEQVGLRLDMSGELVLGVSRILGRIPLSLVALNPEFIRSATDREFSPGYRLFKRTVDMTVAIGLGLIVLPFLPIVAVAIRLDSSGPVIYQQTRLGRRNKRFSIYKFRTMTRDAEAHGAVYAAQNDSRVTRVGSFMRRTRIDEIPQLWNILRGDMSLVGPRPERPENLARLESAIPEFSARTSIRPGITGWAQVSSVHYAATTEETGRKVEYDFYYIVFASAWLDMNIWLRTIGVIIRFRGR